MLTPPELAQQLSREVIHQSLAITWISQTLALTSSRLQTKTGPASSFLFIGPRYTGKKTAAAALAKQLKRALYYCYASPHHQTLSDIPFQHHQEKQYATFHDIMQQTPQAILVYEDSERLSESVKHELQLILQTGYWKHRHITYDCCQSIIILNTTIGATHFATPIAPTDNDDQQATYFTRLLTRTTEATPTVKEAEIANTLLNKILPELMSYFQPGLYGETPFIPFLPLDQQGIEKIVRLKLRLLDQTLQAQYHVSLGYAPEVTRYFLNELLTKQVFQYRHLHPDKILAPLYLCVEKAIQNQPEPSQTKKKIFLQLHETGQQLQYHWLTETPSVTVKA